MTDILAEIHDANVIHAPTLNSAEVRLSGVDEYVLMKLTTDYEEFWVRVSRENFAGLVAHLNNQLSFVKGN